MFIINIIMKSNSIFFILVEGTCHLDIMFFNPIEGT